jgi:hypothetical protein
MTAKSVAGQFDDLVGASNKVGGNTGLIGAINTSLSHN